MENQVYRKEWAAEEGNAYVNTNIRIFGQQKSTLTHVKYKLCQK
jgi:hypothetical protein